MLETREDLIEALKDAEHNYAALGRVIDAIRLVELYNIIEEIQYEATQHSSEEWEPDSPEQ